MQKLISAVLIFLAGWTLAANATSIFGGSLDNLMLIAPIFIAILMAIFAVLSKNERLVVVQTCSVGSCMDAVFSPRLTLVFVLGAICAVVLLGLCWKAFWLISVSILAAYCFFSRGNGPQDLIATVMVDRRSRYIVWLVAFAAAFLTLWVCRSDADDAFYIGIAAFAHSHPVEPLLRVDPMHEEHGWPLIFPSYRFSSYELLAAGFARVLGVPAMDIMYRLLPPFAAGLVVVAMFLLAQQLSPRRWLMLGLSALALGIVLGECHRGPANFLFVRLFQGKAIYLSALLPLIYVQTFRCAMVDRWARELMLLGCALVASIGMSNFGMLAAPMAGATALFSVVLQSRSIPWPRILAIATTLLIPIPYLLAVAFAMHDNSGIFDMGSESAAAVWTNVFGQRQQYFVAMLMLVGPAFVRGNRSRIWLAAPSLILLAVFLNPWLADFIARYVTTPPVYWRVTWCFPVLVYLAWSLCAIVARAMEAPRIVNLAVWVAAVGAVLAVFCLPYNVLRPGNGVHWQFAGRKVPSVELRVAERISKPIAPGARILAPESISSIVAMFEQHAPLVGVREMYLQLLAPAMGDASYQYRKLLLNFASGSINDDAQLRKVPGALNALAVGTVVTTGGVVGRPGPINSVLLASDFTPTESIGSYIIWHRNNLARQSNARISGSVAR